uniref:Uncharacterized protein n=1 Tax=Sander lucioperca TaxID=283035 RepID=A0A8D0A7S2_SANLU
RQYHYVLSTVGLTTACLKAAGTEPKLRQELKKVRRLDPMVLLKTSFTILAGTMSRGPLVGFMCCTTSLSNVSESGLNSSNTAECAGEAAEAQSYYK